LRNDAVLSRHYIVKTSYTVAGSIFYVMSKPNVTVMSIPTPKSCILSLFNEQREAK